MEHDEVSEAVENARKVFDPDVDASTIPELCGTASPDGEFECTRARGHAGSMHVAANMVGSGAVVPIAKWRAYLPLPIRVRGTEWGNYVWIEHEPPPDKSDGGIVIPHLSQGGGVDDSKNTKVFARVVAVGPGRVLPKVPPPTGDSLQRLAPLWWDAESRVWRERRGFEVGDRVVVGRYEGHHLHAFDRDLVCLYEHAIDAVVEE